MVQENASQLSVGTAAPPSVPSLSKADTVCHTLRMALPSYDAVLLTLTNKGAWWSSYELKMRAFSGAPVTGTTESVESFAAKAYTSRNPGELGTLVVAFARSSGESDDLYALVESLVVSDLTFSATPKGLKCMVMLAKVHTDIGKPRKSWMLWRQAMTTAQLMVRASSIDVCDSN